MQKKYFEIIDEFKEVPKASKLMIDALKEMLPEKDNRFAFYFSIVLGFLLGLIIGFSSETVVFFAKTCELLIDVQLAIFGCVFAVYSILLAFLSDRYVKRLAKISAAGEPSMLKKYITYYESVLFLYFINIGISGMILLFVDCIAPDARLTGNLFLDNSLATVGLTLYFSFSFRVFYEVKSTIYNTIVLLRTSMAYRFLDFLEEEEKLSK